MNLNISYLNINTISQMIQFTNFTSLNTQSEYVGIKQEANNNHFKNITT